MNTDHEIKISFDMYSDTPIGKDPDYYSPTLGKYHKLLWSQELPNGSYFELKGKLPNSLIYSDEIHELSFSSDSIGHTYSRTKSMKDIVSRMPQDEIEQFFKTCSTIGAYIIFPSKRVNNQMTINGARGLNKHVKDRFDLTLECIRRYYIDAQSPLTCVLQRYSIFFKFFVDFKGYVNFFHLNDLVCGSFNDIKFFLPFDDFHRNPLPTGIEEYLSYKENVTNFINARNKRILSSQTKSYPLLRLK